MQTNEIRPAGSILSDIQIIEVQKISNDLAALKHFIDQINSIKDDQIKALYIVTDKNYQIEFKGRFSEETTNELFNLILLSRERLARKLETILTSYLSETKTKDAGTL